MDRGRSSGEKLAVILNNSNSQIYTMFGVLGYQALSMPTSVGREMCSVGPMAVTAILPTPMEIRSVEVWTSSP